MESAKKKCTLHGALSPSVSEPAYFNSVIDQSGDRKVPTEFLEIAVKQDKPEGPLRLQCSLLSPSGVTVVGETKLNPKLRNGASLTEEAMQTILAGQTWKPCGTTVFLSRDNPEAVETDYCTIAGTMTEEKTGWFKRQFYHSFAAHRITPAGLVGPLAQTGRFTAEDIKTGEAGIEETLKEQGWTPVPGRRSVWVRPIT